MGTAPNGGWLRAWKAIALALGALIMAGGAAVAWEQVCKFYYQNAAAFNLWLLGMGIFFLLYEAGIATEDWFRGRPARRNAKINSRLWAWADSEAFIYTEVFPGGSAQIRYELNPGHTLYPLPPFHEIALGNPSCAGCHVTLNYGPGPGLSGPGFYCPKCGKVHSHRGWTDLEVDLRKDAASRLRVKAKELEHG